MQSNSTNAFVTEMATRNIKDFKTRSRTNMVPRVAKRIDGQERKAKDLADDRSSRSNVQLSQKQKKAPKAHGHEKVMSYAEIKKWNQKYLLDGKSVYQLDAEFTSLVKIQVQEL